MSKEKHNAKTTHFRIWKSGKKWLYSASVLTLLVGEGTAIVPILGDLITHADTTTESTPASSSTTQEAEIVTTEGVATNSGSSVTETTPSNVGDSSETTSSFPSNTANELITSPMAPSKLSTVVAAAAKIYKATDLINQGIITNVQVTWSMPDNTVAQNVAMPTKVTFTIASNSVLSAGDVIDFGSVSYTGAQVGNSFPNSASYSLPNGDLFDGKNRYTLNSSYNGSLSQVSTLNLSGGGSASKGDTSTDIVTATYLNSVTHTVYTWQTDVPIASNLSGYVCGNASTSTNAGKGSVSFYQNNQQYQANVLNGNYDSTVGNAPTGDVVTIFHISASDAQKIDLTSITQNPSMVGQLYRLTPDGKNIAGNDSGSVRAVQVGNVSFPMQVISLNKDLTDAEIVASTPAMSAGWVQNSDGSLTLYFNQGSLNSSKVASSNAVKDAVMNNPWEGTQEGIDQATPILTNPQFNMSECYGSTSFGFTTIDTSSAASIVVSGTNYSTDGYSKNLGSKTLNIAAAVGAQEGQSTIKVHYLDENGNTLKGVSNNFGWPVGSTGNPAGDTLAISADSLKIPGYHLDTSKLPSNISGVDTTTGAVASISYPAENTTLDVAYTYIQDTYTVVMSKVAQTIHYVDTKGNIVAPDSVQYVTFATITDDQTGAVTKYCRVGDYTQDNVKSSDGTLPYPYTTGTSTNFDTVANPIVSGSHWVSSSVTGDTASETSAQAVTNQGPDQTVTVTYAPDTYTVSLSKVGQTIHYVDDKGTAVAPDAMQFITFATVKNDQTGTETIYYRTGDQTGAKVTSTDGTLGTGWTAGTSTNFGTVANPAVNGSHWVSSSVTGDTASETSVQAVTNKDTDQAITVTYAADTYTVSLSKVSQTIHYVDDKGDTVAPDVVQAITFATVKNDQTGAETTYYQSGDHTGDTATSTDGTLGIGWTAGASTDFNEVANPTVNGLHWISSNVTGDTSSETRKQAVKSQGTDQEIIVTYAADTYTVSLTKVDQTIHYLDDKGNTVAPDSVQDVTFATVKNDQTSAETIYYQEGDHTGDTVTSTDGTLGTPWIDGKSTNFGAVANPTVSDLHWTKSSVTSDTASETSAQPVTSQDTDQVITVTYVADLVSVPTLPTLPNQPTPPNQPTQVDQKTKENAYFPETGERQGQNTLILGLGILLLMVVGFVSTTMKRLRSSKDK